MKMKSIIPLWLIALVATPQTFSVIDNNNKKNNYLDRNGDESESSSINNNLQNNQAYKTKVARDRSHIIDGRKHRIKGVGITYRQRLRDDQCIVEYDGQHLTENSILKIGKKLYRVEDCLLERVFHACGPNLLLMIHIVCRAIEEQRATTTPATKSQRSTIPPSPFFFRWTYGRTHRMMRADKTRQVITESCCEGLCTISELSRYCYR